MLARVTASAMKATFGGPRLWEDSPALAGFVPPFPLAFATATSGKSPNTDTSSSEGDLAGGGVSHADPDAEGGGYEGGEDTLPSSMEA